MSFYKDINFNHFLRGVELSYADKPRVDSQVADQREQDAYERGRQEASAELNEQILLYRQEVQHLLGETLERVDQKVDHTMKEIVENIPGLVMSIAKRVLAEIDFNGQIIKGIVDDVISDLPSSKDQVEIFLSSGDLKLFLDYASDLAHDYPHCTFLEDVTLEAADCRVESKFGAIDATVDTKLKHIEEQLRS